jgi:protein-tyrosine phosphatase
MGGDFRMIDIHSHIVWGVDDGAPSIEVSLKMLEAARESGTTDIVATPHMNAEFPYDPEITAERIRELAAASGGAPRIHLGCEFHLSVDNLDQLTASPRRYTINGKQYLLMEFPDHHVGRHAEKILEQLLDSDITPIIAHPERVPVLQQDPERLGKWVDLGCLTQLTAISILGVFGKSTAAVCEKLFKLGLVHIVASDAHDPSYRHTRLAEAFAVVRDRYGEDVADLLFRHNPRCVIEGYQIAGGREPFEVFRARQWWQFWKPKGEIE